MEITEVQVRYFRGGPLRGMVTLTLDGCFVVRGLKLVETRLGLRVPMPSRRGVNGMWKLESLLTSAGQARDLEARILEACERGLEHRSETYRESLADGGPPPYDLSVLCVREDAGAVARPLMDAIAGRGLRVYRELCDPGGEVDFRSMLDSALRRARFGVVVLSTRFLSHDEARWELAARFSIDDPQTARLLPVWHRVDIEDLSAISPTLAARPGFETAGGIGAVSDAIIVAILAADHANQFPPRASS